jgi:tetratricopeptide (TPR) repeat protein
MHLTPNALHRFIIGAALVSLSLPISTCCRAQTQAAPRYDFQEITQLEQEKKFDAALAKANAAVEADPKSIDPYVVRGHLYSEMGQWEKADADFATILQIDPDNFPAQFNRCEVKLALKDYDDARQGFFNLEKNPDWGDLAKYKVFVCDLFAGHQIASASELETLKREETHASYFFANATWNFYHNQPREAQSWLDSATRIYPRKTIYFYAATLVDSGYIAPLQEDVKVP